MPSCYVLLWDPKRYPQAKLEQDLRDNDRKLTWNCLNDKAKKGDIALVVRVNSDPKGVALVATVNKSYALPDKPSAFEMELEIAGKCDLNQPPLIPAERLQELTGRKRFWRAGEKLPDESGMKVAEEIAEEIARRLGEMVKGGKVAIIIAAAKTLLRIVKQFLKSSKDDGRQIGRRGELLVQSRLLRYGIESAPMTTDSGVDLVALHSERKSNAGPVTIQVKTTSVLWTPDNPRAYTWTLPKESPAEVIAFVAVDKIPERIWMFRYADLRGKVKRNSFQIYLSSKRTGVWTVENCEPHLLENIVAELFPPPRK